MSFNIDKLKSKEKHIQLLSLSLASLAIYLPSEIISRCGNSYFLSWTLPSFFSKIVFNIFLVSSFFVFQIAMPIIPILLLLPRLADQLTASGSEVGAAAATTTATATTKTPPRPQLPERPAPVHHHHNNSNHRPKRNCPPAAAKVRLERMKKTAGSLYL